MVTFICSLFRYPLHSKHSCSVFKVWVPSVWFSNVWYSDPHCCVLFSAMKQYNGVPLDGRAMQILLATSEVEPSRPRPSYPVERSRNFTGQRRLIHFYDLEHSFKDSPLFFIFVLYKSFEQVNGNTCET